MSRTDIKYWKSQLDDIWLEQMSMIHKGKNIEEGITKAYGYLICSDTRLNNSDGGDFKRLVHSFLCNMKAEKKTIKLKFEDL